MTGKTAQRNVWKKNKNIWTYAHATPGNYQGLQKSALMTDFCVFPFVLKNTDTKKWNNDFFFFPNFRHNFSIGLSWSACINRSFTTVHASIQLVQQTYFLFVN